MEQENGGRLVRQAWIDGVQQYYPGTPKHSYIAPWEEMPQWERDIVTEIYTHVRAIVQAGMQDSQSIRLNREQGGRLVRIIWIGQVYRHIAEPKPTYVCHWEEMSSWEQETDMGMFEAVQNAVLQEAAHK